MKGQKKNLLMVMLMKFTANVTFRDPVAPVREEDPVAASLLQLLQTLQESNPDLLARVMTQLAPVKAVTS